MGELVANLPTLPALPPMSEDLRSWFWTGSDMQWLPPRPGRNAIQLPRYRAAVGAVRSEAKRLLSSYHAAAQPATAAFLCRWLQPLAMVARNPVPPDELEPISAVFAAALATIPVGAYSHANWLRMMQTQKFWPSPADLAELLQDDAREIRRAVEVLTFIADEDRA